MADTKISALTASTTPLAGTEVLPIVQTGTTKQVSVANLTAGRAVSAASVAATGRVSGNYVTSSGVVESTGNNLGHGASRVIMSYEGGGASFIQPYSTSAGTQGTLYVRCMSSDGSLSTIAAQFDASNVTLNTGNLVIGTSGKGITTSNVGQVTQDYFSGFTSGVAKVISPTRSSGFMVFVTGYSLTGGYSAILNFGDTISVANVLNTTGGTVAFSSVSNQLNITSTGSASQILQEIWVSVIGK
jgi:hypothetical protein